MYTVLRKVPRGIESGCPGVGLGTIVVWVIRVVDPFIESSSVLVEGTQSILGLKDSQNPPNRFEYVNCDPFSVVMSVPSPPRVRG